MTSQRLALFTLLLGAVLGLLVGSILGPHLGGDARTAARAGEGPLAPEHGADRRGVYVADDAAGALVAPLAPMAQDARSEASAAASERLAGSAAARAAAEVRQGAAAERGPEDRGHIDGIVVDQVGKPVVGATVVSQNTPRGGDVFGARSARVGRAWKGPESLDEALTNYAKGAQKRIETLRSATTDSAGRFQLAELKPGAHSLSVYAEGLVFGAREVFAGEMVHLVGRPVCEFHLDLRLPDGNAPSSALVLLGEERRSETYHWSPEEPVLRIEERVAQLRVFAGDILQPDYRNYLSTYSAASRTIDLARDGEGPHVIELALRTRLLVHLEDHSQLETKLTPWVKAVAAQTAAAPSDGETFKDAPKLARIEGQRFCLMDLAPGAWVIGAGRGAGAPEVTARAEVGPGTTEVSLRLGEVDMSKFLVVRCKGPEGAPQAGVSFAYATVTKSGSSSGGLNPTERPGGEYWINRDDLRRGQDASASAQVRLSATARGHGTLDVDLDEHTQELELAFQAACDLHVVVTGDLTAGFSISIEPLKAKGEGEEHDPFRGHQQQPTRIDGDGRAILTGLQPGPIRVSLLQTTERFAFRAPSVASAELTLRPGLQSVALVAPQLYELVVHVPDVEVGTSLQLGAAGEVEKGRSMNRQAKVGADNRARFARVPAGEYALHLWAGKLSGSMQVQVPTGEVLFQIGAQDALRVSRVIAGQLAARAGLQDGDLVVKVGGRDVDGYNALQRLFLDLSGGTATVQVQRGAQTLELTLGPGSKADVWEELGATLTVASR